LIILAANSKLVDICIQRRTIENAPLSILIFVDYCGVVNTLPMDWATTNDFGWKKKFLESVKKTNNKTNRFERDSTRLLTFQVLLSLHIHR
jgi:hypothetical protein